ncbi:MAG TPA: hypothetical protein VJO13_20475, partial [Ktedonobacterales bacterium]|nr:hypothetical protein [Ktedonobacterales bacterium]
MPTQQLTPWDATHIRPPSRDKRATSPGKSPMRRWTKRAYPAVLLAVVACLLAVLACDLSPTILSALSRAAHGNESGSQSGVEIPTPAHYPPEKPLTFADLVNQTVNYNLSRMTLDEKIG